MDFLDAESKTGFRMPFQYFPANKNVGLKFHLPIGFFYSPFVAETQSYSATAPKCGKCGSIVHPFADKNRNARKWKCGFCATESPLLVDVGNYTSEEYIEAKSGETGLFFVIDSAMAEDEFQALKDTIIRTIPTLPRNIFVGLVVFGKVVFVCDFSEPSDRFYTFNEYTPIQIRQQLGIGSKNDPRANVSNIATSKFYVPLEKYQQKLIKVIESLEHDTFAYDAKTERPLRATGCALNIALSLIEATNINTRLALLISGPCTFGPGQVVGLPLKETMRTFLDINENNDATRFIKNATKFYQSQEKRLIGRHSLDIWAYGLDQYGLMEMKDMCTKSGGLLAMHEMFKHFIFDSSFSKHYESNEAGTFKFPIAARLSMYISKEMKINGMIGFAKGLKEDKLSMASEMVIGEGETNCWYIGGIQQNSALTFFVTNADDSKEAANRVCVVQMVTQFKYSDNLVRTRVNTITKEYVRDTQLREVIKTFDQEAGIVLLARLAVYKAAVEEVVQVKTWLDRILLKFVIRFANYSRYDTNSFRLPAMMKLFPQFAYHLRRSQIVNTFGVSPDESIYIRSCLFRECLANCLVMIQPALIMYTVDDPNPKPVNLDIENLREDVVLLLDSYFNVLIWYGEHIYNWKLQNLQQQEEYSYLQDLFKNPLDDSADIIYDRVPVSNYYETFKGDGKERYLKSRVNPSVGNKSQSETGNFQTDDAPIKMFMDFLIKSVVNYSE